jgi:signal peptidase
MLRLAYSSRALPEPAPGKLQPVALHALPAPLWAVLLQPAALAVGGLLVLIVTAMFLLLAIVPRTGLYATYTVLSPSMEPTIRMGSIVIVEPVSPANVQPGDVVAVTSLEPPYTTITHRVTRLVMTDHGAEFKTKGDANALEDPWQFAYSDRAGKVQLSVPAAGYLLDWSGTLWGRLSLAGTIALLLVGYFVPAIWRSTSGAGKTVEGRAFARRTLGLSA